MTKTKTNLTQGLNTASRRHGVISMISMILMIALELLRNTSTPKDGNYQQAIEAMMHIREWTKDAVVQINTLQAEIERAHIT